VHVQLLRELEIHLGGDPAASGRYEGQHPEDARSPYATALGESVEPGKEVVDQRRRSTADEGGE
jgi:hypothetical protein